ncbi:MAG: nucleotide sugar dehydrogenase [Candidatus Bathyarchaeota archaeon]|nr:nucleotide sugar dehydrogenase [Candidatus Bathyarchaeota archaeon]MCZ2845440.1 nucleotide sugar dehydrogenase [Candidatus Bathyarchaeota archaeon]
MKIAVIGLGVGYALSCCLAEVGHDTIGIDIDPNIVKQPREDPSIKKLLLKKNKVIERNLKLSTDYSKIKGCKIAIICVSTGDEHRLHIGSVANAIRSCINNLEPGSTILVYSTLPIGSSKLIINIFKEENAENIDYVYMPLMIAQGKTADGFINPPFVVFGSYDEYAAEETKTFYLDFIKKSFFWNKKIPPNFTSSPEEAEIIKLSTNAFLFTKMSFANMTSMFCEELNLDSYKILDVIGSDPRIGKKMLKPGYAVGGNCFPRDLDSLIETYEKNKIKSPLFNSIREINNLRLKDPIIKMKKNGIYEGKILLLGASYKSGVPMLSNSPSIKLRDLLKHEDYEVVIYDPKIEEFNKIPEIDEFDAIIITIDEPEFAEILNKLKTKLLLDYRMKFNE